MGQDKMTPEYRPVKDAHKTLGLWSIRRALTFAFTAAVVLLVAAWFLLSLLLGSPPHAKPKPLETKDLLELLKLVFALVAGVGALVALVTAYRRQRVDEAAGERAERVQAHVEYGQAVEQLGHDKAAVRLGGLYSLERLAQDHPYYRQTVTDVVCSYLRMPFQAPADLDEESHGQPQDWTPDDSVNAARQELQVRLTAQRLIKRHLTTTPPDQPHPPTYWNNIDIVLTGAYLIDIDFSNCRPANANFTNAHFTGTTAFTGARFSGYAGFSKARFTGDARFDGTQFSGDARFDGTQFSGYAGFSDARFSGYGRFDGAHFSEYGRFDGAHFSEYAGFEEAEFSQKAWFDRARFSEYAGFSKAQFSGDARFSDARFSGYAEFSKAQFSGDARFSDAQFSGYAEFDGAQFTGTAWFRGAQFEREGDFTEATASYPNADHVWPSPWRAQAVTTDTAQLTREG